MDQNSSTPKPASTNIASKQQSETQLPAENIGSAPDGGVRTAASAELDERVQAAIQAARDKRALDVVVLDLRAVASFTDYFLITSGTNTRQVQAIADEVVERLKKQGTRAARVEGYGGAEWVLLDYGDFVMHIFEEKARRFYDLERLWRDAARVALPADLSTDERGGGASTANGSQSSLKEEL